MIAYISMPLIVSYEHGKYDKNKYQRYTNYLVAEELNAYKVLGLPVPLNTKTNSTGTYVCKYHPAGYGAATARDACTTAYHAAQESGGIFANLDDVDSLIRQHGWVSHPNALARFKEGPKKSGNSTIAATIVYTQPYADGELRLSLVLCDRTTIDCRAALEIFKNEPWRDKLYEIIIRANPADNAIQKWGG